MGKRDPATGHSAWAYLLGGLALAALLVAVLRPAAWASLPDFDKAYYPAGRKALAAPATLYDAPIVDFVNVPLVALLFAPFAGLPEPHARLAFALLGALAVVVAAVALWRFTRPGPWRWAAAVALLALCGPLHYSFALGNLSHVLLPLLLAAFAADRAGRDALAGALVGLAALIKIPLLVLPLSFLLRRRWRALAGFAVTVAGLAGLSLLLFGFDLHRVWFERCIRPFAEGPLGAYNVQSVDGFLARLTTKGGRQDFSPLAVGPAFHAARLTLLAVLAGTVLVVCSARAAGPATATLDLAIALALALVASPISWTHYYAFLLLPLWLALAGWIAPPRAAPWRALGVAGALLVLLPVLAAPGRAGPALLALHRATAHSPHFVGGVLLLAALLAARWEATRPLRR
jgi:hypothetical protein